jgi:hypothetical protein
MAVGVHTLTVRVADRSGNASTTSRSYTVLDEARADGSGGIASTTRVPGGHTGLVLLTAPPAAVAFGQTVRLDVQALSEGLALAGRRVVVDVDGTVVTTATTDVGGVATVAIPVRRSGEVRAQVPGTGLTRVVAHLAVAPVVRIRTSTRQPRRGVPVTLRGSVQPVGSARLVFLEARIGSAWFPLRRSVRVGADGRFQTTVRSSTAGRIGVRVRTSSARGWAAATSNPVDLRVRR